MSTEVKVTLAGFTPYECENFDSFFQLAAQRSLQYRLVDDPAGCDIAVANADSLLGMATVREHGLMTRTLMIGATPRYGAAAQLPRPLNMQAVLRELDRLAQRQIDRRRSLQRVAEDMASITGVLAPNVNPRELAASAAGAGVDLLLPDPVQPVRKLKRPKPAVVLADALPAGEPGLNGHANGHVNGHANGRSSKPTNGEGDSESPRLDAVLVVDGDEESLRFIATRLEPYGFEVRRVNSGPEALLRTQQREYDLVFIDSRLEGLDGFYICKSIKRQARPAGRRAPTVVMMTQRDEPLEQMRGQLAGCDGFLPRPLDESDLERIVGDRVVGDLAYADTATVSRTLV